MLVSVCVGVGVQLIGSSLGRCFISPCSSVTCWFATAFGQTSSKSCTVFGHPSELVRHSVINTSYISLSKASNLPFKLKSAQSNAGR